MIEEKETRLFASLIGSGFYHVNKLTAQLLCGGNLPEPGNEKLVENPEEPGTFLFVARNRFQGQRVWSVRRTDWRLVDGAAVLGK